MLARQFYDLKCCILSPNFSSPKGVIALLNLLSDPIQIQYKSNSIWFIQWRRRQNDLSVLWGVDGDVPSPSTHFFKDCCLSCCNQFHRYTMARVLPSDLVYVKGDGPRSSTCRFVSLQELEGDEGIVTLHKACLLQIMYYR